MNKLYYTEDGTMIDSVTKKPVGCMDTEDEAKYVTACVNACLGIDVSRLEILSVLPMFLEMRRLSEALSDSQAEAKKLRASVRGYEKALATVNDCSGHLGVSAL